MSRPIVKEERTAQILDAFEACVARYGVEGATLAKTAEQAGLARALIRHNVGNREHLLAALVERFLENSSQATRAMVEALPDHNQTRTLVGWLFDPAYSNPQQVRVAGALISASAVDEDLARKMQSWLDDFVSALGQVMSTEHPKAGADTTAAVAAGITGIYFNVEALYPLGSIAPFAKASEEAALLLVKSLETAQ